MTAKDPLVRLLPAHWESWFTAGLGLVLFPVGVVVFVHGVQLGSIVFGIAGAVVALLSFPLLAVSGMEVLRRPALRTTQLVIPRTFRRSHRVALEDISGVGLLYEIGGPRPGWSLRVWTQDGGSLGVPTVRSYRRGHRAPDQPPPPDGTPRRHRPRLDWQAQAQTPAGRAATAVGAEVLRVQGAHGPLATRRDQCSAPCWGTYLAYWSPDGEIGWTERDD